MNNEKLFMPPTITDEDIVWATSLLGLSKDAFFGQDGTDPRAEVLKTMTPLDVAACPGSGKTTLLVAKLAILARKWQAPTCGICVLSHTNAARYEIESRLGSTSVGQSLLSYPHFVGTIHSFVNTFLALPWLRSLGYSVKMVNTEISQTRRWKALSRAIRARLEENHYGASLLSVVSASLELNPIKWAGGLLKPTGSMYQAIQKVCRQSVEDGYFCYGEMFVWARDLLAKRPSVASVLQGRFPLLFIDEAQDNSEDQSRLLHLVFMDGDRPVVRQRFGDTNQAIYDFVGATAATTDQFPNVALRKQLPNSHRFGQRIADIADPLGLVPHQLKGQGPKQVLASGLAEGRHTIFIFDVSNIDRVLPAYARLLLDTFSKEELRKGSFTAVGQIHKHLGDDHKPRHVGHYWPDYDPEIAGSDPMPRTFVQYIYISQQEASMLGQAYPAAEQTSRAVLRMAGMVTKTFVVQPHRNSYRYILRLLDNSPEVRRRFCRMVEAIAGKRELCTEELWTTQWSKVVLEAVEVVCGCAVASSEAEEFLVWTDKPVAPMAANRKSGAGDNVYRYPEAGKEVAIQVGSIHSVKGKTHTATLVLETYWQDKKGRHNLELLLPWLCRTKYGTESAGVQQQSRLKLHYVAMTRPTHLLCLAMMRNTLQGSSGKLDEKLVKSLTGRGWNIQEV